MLNDHPCSSSFVHPGPIILHLAALGNDHIQVRHVPASVARLGILHLGDNVHAVHHLAKHDVLAVQERRRDRCDEELRAVGVGAGVLLHANPRLTSVTWMM